MRPPRVIEIGEVPLMRQAYPDTTEFFSTGPRPPADLGPNDRHVSLNTLGQLRRRLAARDVDIVVVQPAQHTPWSVRGLSRDLFRRSTLLGQVPLLRTLGPQLIRGRVAAPIAVWDIEEVPYIFPHNFYLLDRVDLYFKRELPPDHWRVFMSTDHWRTPTPRYRAIARNRARIAKLRPLSLGPPFNVVGHPAAQPVPAQEKTSDVFFSGRVENSSTVRGRGLAELLRLREAGFRIDIADKPLPTEEFLRRCAKAHIVWSPEGFGWECFRTYEAALCGSVALMNRQTVDRHEPLKDGIHALYYDVEPGELTRVMTTALADKDSLARIAAAGRAHVLQHHTPAAIARYIVTTTLAHGGRALGDKRPGGEPVAADFDSSSDVV